jgi:uncharacterized protein (TIGR00297 family)
MLMDLLPRTLIGASLAGAVALWAFRSSRLTLGGAYAAVAIGTAAAAGGGGWAIALVAFFYTSLRFGDWKAETKRERSYDVLPNAMARDAWQVLANGGAFAVGALWWGVDGSWQSGLFGFGALATATADTWATEVGMALNATPRHVVTWRHVAPGTSGGLSAFGLGAAMAGSFLIALFAIATFRTPFDVPRLEAVLVGGLTGSLADSLLGATLQSRRWCEQCKTWTERRVHTCGYRSRHARGFRWMTNDVVNLLATVAGGLAAVGLSRP